MPQFEASKILIIKPSALGDIIHSLPFLAALRGRYPAAEVHWVIAAGLQELLDGHPMIDRLWVIRKDQWRVLSRAGETARELKALFKGLRAEGFDMAVDLQGLMRSGLIARASGAQVRVGFREAREGSALFYTHKVPASRDLHAIVRYLKIAAFLGCDTSEISYPLPPLPHPPPGLPVKYVVIAPSAGKAANRWPAERFGRLAARLGVSSVIISGKSDARIAEEAAAASGGKAMSLAGKTGILEMAAVIKGARALISNDTGPMHMAAAFGVPVFAIFGPANPERTGPYGEGHTVITAAMECAPCYRKRKCRDWRCMEAVSVEQVFSTISTALNLAVK